MKEMTKEVHLSNGIVVLLEQVPELESFTMGFFVKTGAKNEREEENGVSHYIEHMMFKGTESRSAKEISESIDNEGGIINAYTSREITAYYVKLLSNKLDVAVDILSDMFLHPTFTQENLDKERNVIIEEIRMYEDSPEDSIQDENIQFALKGAQSNSISGTVEGIKKITREQFLDYFRAQYRAENLIIAISGKFDEDFLLKELEEKMGAFPSEGEGRAYDPSFSFGKGEKLIQRDTQQVHLCFNTRGIKANSDLRYAVSILSSALGGGMSARLFQSIREERGLAYSVYTYNAFYEECGLFMTYAGTTKEAYREVLDCIRKEYADIKANGITETELQRCKNQYSSALMFNLENSRGRMGRLVNSYLLHGKVESTDTVIEKIQNIKMEDIKRAAEYLFDEDYYSWTILGNVAEEEEEHAKN